MARRNIFRRIAEILDTASTFREALRDLGIWGPIVTFVAAGVAWLWASTANLPLPVKAALVITVLAVGLTLMLIWHIYEQVRPLAMPDDLARSHVSHFTFRIADLARDDMTIYDKTFEDCTIFGPAVLVPQGVGMFVECEFPATKEQVVWSVDGRTSVTGAIAIKGCVFRRCRLIKIGLVGKKNMFDQD